MAQRGFVPGYNQFMDLNRRIFLTICLLAVEFMLAPSTSVYAASRTLLSFPVPEEKATVYDENGNGVADMTGDTWVFDQNGDGNADLIIRFRQADSLTATIYDDVNANQRVEYTIGDREIQILEPHWRVQITARDGSWTLPDGFPDWNLDLQADSGFYVRSAVPIPSTVSCKMDTDTVAIGLDDHENIQRYGPASVDGQPDFQTRYWDVNKDGIPDYEWRSISWDGPKDVIITNFSSNLHYVAKHRFPPLETLLGMDWSKAHLIYINTLIPTRSDESGYFLLFNKPALPNQVNAAWENPFAFYDLQGDHDCVPELRLRAVSDLVDRTHNNFIAYDEIRYSWAQDTNAVQYRLYLIGQAYSDAVGNYPVYPVAHFDYAGLPAFVLNQAWRGASFAAAEPGMHDRGFPEGFYENLGYTPALRAFILDHIPQNFPARYLPLYLNMREEFNLTSFNQSPRLYFNSIDRRLHLLGAKEGTVIFSADTSNPEPGFDFNLQAAADGTLNIYAETIYADTDGDGYIDTWTYRENGQNVQQLVVRPGVAVLTVGSVLQVKKLPADSTVSSWLSAPPATPAEWKSLETKLAPAQAGRRPLNDLIGIFADLPGEAATLPGTALTSVSIQEHELFAGIITLGIDSASMPSLLSASGLSNGNYILHAGNGAFQIENLSPQALELSPLALSTPVQQVDGMVGLLSTTIKNPGNVDVAAHISIWDTLSRRTVLFDQDKTIPAAGQIDVSLPWAPPLSGAHQLTVQVNYGDAGNDQPLGLSQQLDWQVNLPDPTPNAILLSQPYLGVVVALMIFLTGFVLMGAWMMLKEFDSNDEPDDQ
jgi:hypothetical protein